ncbi:site-specific DNA-methyltransferase [Collinsella sp. An268]|uniref:site-specific DNA-methyltransferase n=1 Tax=Collinsella sp. An268 TaxID=1965612 RepID=UPI000B39F88D|nr:site-specific DNA-methyltransferase [Collinsella sp. An268]OUO63938.1 site-specific DNA-methyltransferase [Collinsella sp. An268]
MPTLNWMGKEKVVNHHRDVPYRVLERVPEKGVLDSHGSDCGNMVIHGDNLEALKALLPEYEGKVDCIYIDPPYNTGNEGWRYNDNVNDPRIRKWLGEAVGKEGEDFSRHDKWLCMMYPRLQLLRKLLSPTGAIFISIDDTELANLRLVCDEIFSPSCFVSDVSWQRNYSTRNDSKGIPAEVEHMLVYSKAPGWQPRKLPRTSEMDSKYKNPDNDVMPWRSSDAFAPGAATHQGMVYAIQHPFTGKLLYPYSGSCWRYQQDKMLDYMNGWCPYVLKDLDDADRRAEVCGLDASEVREGVKGIVLAQSVEESKAMASAIQKTGPWPRFFFSRNGKGGIARKTYIDSVGGRLPTNYWPYSEVGHTDEAKKEIKTIFGGKAPFDTPKPTRLIERVLQIAVGDDALVLDSFAGSGTTAHAVLRLNAVDGGSRRFILAELDGYADTVTAERVRRVIAGYGEGGNAVEGIDSGFSYYELGPALFRGDGTLSPDVTRADLARYVWATETRAPYEDLADEHPYLLGEHAQAVYYLAWEPGEETALTYDLLRGLPRKGSPTVIYADRCAIAPERLDEMGVVFKRVPDQIARI